MLGYLNEHLQLRREAAEAYQRWVVLGGHHSWWGQDPTESALGTENYAIFTPFPGLIVKGEKMSSTFSAII